MPDEKPTAEPPAKPRKIAKIVIDRDLCIGAASCVVIAPGTFQMDEENKAYLVDIEAHDFETIVMAAESCPTKAIFLYDENGDQVYP
jgi:ferredoxin